MKTALLRTSAAIAMAFGIGLTSSVDAGDPAGPGQAQAEQPAVAQQDAQIIVVTPEGRRPQSAAMERQQVRVGDGGSVTVLRPVSAGDEKADDEEEDRQRESALNEELIGREVVTEEDEWVGEIDDLVFDRVNGTFHAVVLVGDPRRPRDHKKKKKMSVPLDRLELRDEHVALLGVNKAKLRRLPRFEEGAMPSLTRQAQIGKRMVVPSRGVRAALSRKLSGKRDLEARFGKHHRLRDIRRRLGGVRFGGGWTKHGHRSPRPLR